jgi:hypothetical protein
MGDSVKYQIEKAEHALRSALELGAMHEDPYTLHSIAEALQKLGYIIIMGKTQHVVEDFNVEGGIPFATNYPNVEEVNSPDINLIT